MEVPITDIIIPNRRRSINEDKVKSLMGSIQVMGLINPVSIDSDYCLLAGLHRLEAIKRLNWSAIQVNILNGLDALQAELVEIDENLIRNELTVLQQGDWLVRRDEVLRELGQRAEVGQGRPKNGLDSRPLKSTAQIAKQVGLAESTSQQRKQIAKSILPEVKQLIYGTELENEATNLLYIAKTEPDKQLEVTQTLLIESAADTRRISSKSTNEWWTPAKYIEAARLVLEWIDLDPASSELANKTVQATKFYTKDDNGLSLDWPGKIWLNPPYGGTSKQFASKLVHQFESGITTEAILLVNANSTDTQWFAPMFNYTLCFTNHRIDFNSPDSKAGGSTHGSVFVYFGDNIQSFVRNFKQFGRIVRAIDNP